MAWSVPTNRTSGAVVDVASINAILGDLSIIGGAWTTYTPTLTNITIGNGTILAKYLQINKTVRFRFLVAAGSSTTYAAGNLGVSLPVAAHSDYIGGTANSNWAVGAGIANAAGTRQSITAVITSAGILNFIVDSATASTPVTNTVPGAWGTTSLLSFTVEYEAA